MAAHRLRQRLRKLVEEEIALTVVDPAEITDEYAQLAGILRGLRDNLR